MNSEDLFSTKTRKSLLLREDWMRKLFANPRLDPVHKVVMTAFMLWYFPEHRGQDGRMLMDFSEFAKIVGLPLEEAKEAILDMVQSGVLQMQDEHGHTPHVESHYTCNDCGHEWTGKEQL